MNGPLNEIARRYANALQKYLSAGAESEVALNEVYELGREALKDGLGVLDMASLHHHALAELIGHSPAEASPRQTLKAAEFLAECLSPFEMSLRGYQETNARLLALNKTLEKAYAATHAANDKLITEIAERQRAEETLRQVQRLQVVGQLAAGVAHDFNNLLTVVLGDLDRAAKRAAGDETMTELLTRALSAAERAARITSQFLAFSRRQILLPNVIEPATRLRDTVLLVERSLGDKIRVETTVPDDLWKVRIDGNQLDLALLNIALNSRDAMPAGGVVRVTASNRTLRDERLDIDGDYVVVEIADNGEGIPSDVLPNVFEPFFTTKEVGAGSGLGLSQVYGFAHQSGGAIDIESNVGDGTVVRLYLRSFSDPDATVQTETRPAQDSPGVVLVVEDEAIVAAATGAALKQFGFTVKLAHHAQAALDLLEKGELVDLIFSDIRMPGAMNGIDLAETVKINFPDIPVLLTTGYADAANRGVSSGFNIIGKPYRIDELAVRLKAALRRKPAGMDNIGPQA